MAMNFQPPLLDDDLTTRERTMKLGLTWNDRDPNLTGYIVYSSIYPADVNHNYCRVLNLDGKEVHRWDLGPRRPGLWAYMPEPDTTTRYRKPDQKGLLLAISQMPLNEVKQEHTFVAWENDRGGYIQLLSWEGDVIWTYKDEWQHHDARLTRTGMLAYICNEVLHDESEHYQIVRQAVEHRGFRKVPDHLPKLYSDVIKIVDPISGENLFTWRAAEHFDPEIDVLNFNDPFDEWNHGNTVVPLYENPNDRNQVTHLLVSFRQISTIVKIDVKTGDFIRLLRSPFISQQHDPTIIEEGNSDHILVFNNRYIPNDFAPLAFSTVVQYNLTESAPYPYFPQVVGPKIEWIYLDGVSEFFSAYISGAQRLPGFTLRENGINYTLITEGMKGRIFIVRSSVYFRDDGTPHIKNRVVWEYVNPEIPCHTDIRQTVLGRSSVFRSRLVPPSYFSESQLAKMNSPTSKL